MFRPVPAAADFTALETEELARWSAHRVFERSVELRDGAEPWIFYEGPPTANGRPGLHHVWARVYKDLFCRYRTMRGYAVPRKAGWDTHGLPVEVEVEKQLGITAKRQIEERVGIAEFTRLCRESVRNYVDEWKTLTERIGYWIDFDDAYWTFSPEYVESVWANLKSLFDQELLYEDIKVVPYCPRCGTALSSHELGQPDVYRDVEDESAYVRLPLTDEGDAAASLRRTLGRDSLHGLSLVAWTTTPWTLLSNTGAAVGPALYYAVVDGAIVAADRVEAVFGESARIDAVVPGSALVGLTLPTGRSTDLEPGPADAGRGGWRVLGGEFVEADEGTGVVHLAPAFGEIDREVGRAGGLPTLNPVGPDGRFTDAVAWLEGQPVRETQRRGRRPARGSRAAGPAPALRPPLPPLLAVRHRPHLLGQAELVRPDLGSQGGPGRPEPDHRLAPGAHPGRADGGVAGQQRRLGTLPRPVLGHAPADLAVRRRRTCAASARWQSSPRWRAPTSPGVDPHRPDIDEVVFPCPDCPPGDAAAGGDTGDHERPVMRRVAPVIDAWFDSGSMPTAQWGYPVAEGSADRLVYPADFICEAIDQTRGWFYSLLAVNTLVRGSTPYRNVLCLGHIVDADGRKMSKSIGNVIDPWEILSTRGADPLRWWMFSQGSPWTPTRVSFEVIDASMRDTLLTLWNTWSFFTTYASLNEFVPSDPAVPAPPDRPVLDRWMRVTTARHRCAGHRVARRVRPVPRGHGRGRAHRRRLQLVRPSQQAPVLADRSGRRPGGLARRAGHPP